MIKNIVGKIPDKLQYERRVRYCKRIGTKIKSIKDRIADDSVTIVSFDIFDTLLVRPVISPEDVFEILDDYCHRKYPEVEESFQQLRSMAFREAPPNATLEEAWNSFLKVYTTKSEIIQDLYNEEIKLEEQILRPRKAGQELFECARKYQKHIIAISDMYLDAQLIKKILEQNGYYGISNIYVSCDIKKRKSNGELYDYVLQKENLSSSPKSILHIGDNYASDYLMAKKYGIRSCWIPSNVELFSYSNRFALKYPKDYSNRILLGYGLNACYEIDNRISIRSISSSQFAKLIVFPIVVGSMLFCINNSEIRENYDSVYFMARDGYLPFKVYSILKNTNSESLPASYVYGSRKAYNIEENNVSVSAGGQHSVIIHKI